jgi:dTDP-glucose 4,6-dehydratase
MTSVRPDTIIVTGGAGFIGSHLVDRLVRSGWRVVNLDLLTYAGNTQNLALSANRPEHMFVRGDIADGKLVSRLLAQHRPRVVINMAAESHVDRSIDDAQSFIRTNVDGVHRLLECSLSFYRSLKSGEQDKFRFIQMSTDEVYGSIDIGHCTEASNYQPNSPYAATKAAGDHLARAYGVTFGLPVSIVHASNTYGPRQYPEKLIPHTILSAITGKSLTVYGKGENVRDWLYVLDLADGLERVAQNCLPGRVYNFAGNDERRNIETVRTICRTLDKLRPASQAYENGIAFVQDRPGHDLRYAMSIDGVKQSLDWTPRTPFEAGLPSTIEWYLEADSWLRSIEERGYRVERIGIGR